MFEPQPQFRAKLTALAQLVGARYIPAAAWTTNGSLTFHVSPNSEASSVSSSVSTKWGALQTVSVASVDLAAYLLHTLRLPRADKDTLTLLKLDIESSEYAVLPHLVSQGALCGVRYLHIEWHIDALPPEERLAGLGVMMSLEHVLRIGCTGLGGTAPKLIVREQALKKRELHVPGLGELLQRHAGSSYGTKRTPKA